MSNLEELSEAIASLVGENGPSVVRVEARRGPPSSGVVWSDGLVFAPQHAVEEAEARVSTGDAEDLEARVVGTDPSTDLALLRVEKPGLHVPAWSPPGALKVGHLALAIGRPGRTARASLGIVNTLSEGAWRAPSGGRIDRYLQTDHGLQPGLSGGLLVDMAGRALGMITSGLMRGANLTVPAATLERVAQALLARGAVQRGFLGIGGYPVRLPAPLAQATGQESALLMVSVQPGGPADKAGLMLGDALLSLRGEKVRHLGDLHELLDEEQIGQELDARLVRAGQIRDARITIGVRAAG